MDKQSCGNGVKLPEVKEDQDSAWVSSCHLEIKSRSLQRRIIFCHVASSYGLLTSLSLHVSLANNACGMHRNKQKHDISVFLPSCEVFCIAFLHSSEHNVFLTWKFPVMTSLSYLSQLCSSLYWYVRPMIFYYKPELLRFLSSGMWHCGVVDSYRCFEGTWCFHLWGRSPLLDCTVWHPRGL
jgi:hypothetical protein